MIILGRNNKAHPLSKVNFSQFSCAMDDAIWLEIKDIVWSTVWDNVWENVTFILLENLRGKLDCVKKTVIYTI